MKGRFTVHDAQGGWVEHGTLLAAMKDALLRVGAGARDVVVTDLVRGGEWRAGKVQESALRTRLTQYGETGCCSLHRQAAMMRDLLHDIVSDWSRDEHHDVPVVLIDRARSVLAEVVR